MAWFRKKKTAEKQVRLDARSLYALAALLFLSQLPHVLHLPVWVSALGMAIVGLKLLEHHKPSLVLSLLFSPMGMTIIALGGGVLVRMHYGYFLGRDPCVAFLFILVSAKFAEVRKSADSTLLLCLAGFLLLTQYFYSQSILSALVTLPAVLALGNALSVIRDSRNAPPFKHNLKMVGKLLLQGAPLAAILFVVFPRLPGPMWSLPDDAVAKTGLSESMSPGTIGSLSKSDEVAFRVEFDGAPPPQEQRYWRGPVLSDFDGKKWSVVENTAKLRPTENPSDNNISYSVTVQPTQQSWLFALDHPASLPMSDTADPADGKILAHLTNDLQLKANQKVKTVTRYRQVSALSSSYESPSRPNPLLTQLSGRNPKAMKFATEMRSQSSSDLEYAENLLRYFNEKPFRYTLQPSLLGHSPVDEFLFTTRNGFCEHYASAFVVLLRAAAIPSRVVTGYLGGEMNGDYMIVRQSDAHAWTEAYINGRWTRFDPTGAVAPSRVEMNMASALGSGEPIPLMARGGTSWLREFKLSIDELNYDWQRMIVNFNNESQFKLWKKLGLPKLQLWQITIAVLAVTALWCFVVLGMPIGTVKHKSANEKLWARYISIVKRYGIQKGKSETPGDFVQRAAALTKSSLIQTIGSALIKLRFERINDSEATALRNDIRSQLNKLYLHSLINRKRAHTVENTAQA